MPSPKMSGSDRSRSRSPRRVENPFKEPELSSSLGEYENSVETTVPMEETTPVNSGEQAQKQAEFNAWLEQMREKKDESAGGKSKKIQIAQKFVPVLLGEQGQTVVALREKTSCWIAIDQSRAAETGFSTVNIAADADDKIEQCEQEIAKLITETAGSAAVSEPKTPTSPVLVEKMELPSTLCALLTKDNGKILARVKGKCRADFFIPTVNEPSKIVHISGTQSQIDEAKQILLKMLGSNGVFSKATGLEFLSDEDEVLKTQSSLSTATPGTLSSELTATGSTPPPSMLPSGNSPKFPPGAMAIVSASHDTSNLQTSHCGRWMDSFEVPKKYLGLFIGRKGDAIRKYRERGAALGMEIQIDQQDVATAGTVKVLGMNKDAILSLKAEMTQNLFKAIAHLDAQEAAGNLLSERYLSQAKGVKPQKGHEIMARKHVMMTNMKGNAFGKGGDSGWDAAWKNPDNWFQPSSPLNRTPSNPTSANDLSWLTGGASPAGNSRNSITPWLADVLGGGGRGSNNWDWSNPSTACSTPSHRNNWNGQDDVSSMLASLLEQ